jgi:hypothetical protein
MSKDLITYAVDVWLDFDNSNSTMLVNQLFSVEGPEDLKQQVQDYYIKQEHVTDVTMSSYIQRNQGNH